MLQRTGREQPVAVVRVVSRLVPARAAAATAAATAATTPATAAISGGTGLAPPRSAADRGPASRRRRSRYHLNASHTV